MKRNCLWAIVVGVSIYAASAFGADETAPAFRIERSVAFLGTDQYYYTQARGAMIPGSQPRILITAQETERSGAHGYRDVLQSESVDGGRTWSELKKIDSLTRITLPNKDDLAIGDLCPQWHAASRTILTTGKTFTFHNGKSEDRLLERVSYSVFSPDAGTWSGLHTVELPAADHAGKPILAPNSGCCQRVDLENGDILLPIRYRRDAKSLNYVTMVALCRFDGKTLKYQRHGSELSRAKNLLFIHNSVVVAEGVPGDGKIHHSSNSHPNG